MAELNFALHDKQLEVFHHPARFKVCAAGRRGGKSYLSAVELLIEGLKTTNEEGQNLKKAEVFYIAPTFNQGKDIMWNALMDMGHEVIESVRQNEGVIRLVNGRTIKIKGSDRPETLRGIGLSFVVMDEYADMKPEVWDLIIRPALSDYLGKALFIGCVTKDTWIIGDKGLEKIGECPIGYSDENKMIYGLGGFHKAEKRYANKELQTVKIKTKAGLELEATPNHRIWTPDGWVRMDEIAVGQKTYMQIGQECYGDIECDLDWAYFLGLYTAEGNSELGIYRTTITIGDDEVHDWLSNKYGFKRYDSFHSRLNSKKFQLDLAEWMPDIGTVRAPQKIIHDKVLRMTKTCQQAFLSGYFDGDGTVQENKKSVSSSSSSKELSKQIQMMLLNMGYRAKLSHRITKPTQRVSRFCDAWIVEIDGESAIKFSKEICFRLKRKQDKTLDWEHGVGHEYWFNRKDFGRLNTKYGYLGRIKKISRKLLDEIDIDGAYDRQLLADTVTEVDIGFAGTYDFCIPETNSYFSNGLVSHNTPAGKNHFYDLWCFAGEMQKAGHPEWAAFHFNSTDNPRIKKTEIEAARNSMSAAAFRQEYEASFAAGGGGTFKEEYLKYADSSPEDGDIYIAWDLAGFGDGQGLIKSAIKRADEHAGAVVEVSPDGWFVHEIIHGRWDVRETALRIIKAAKDYQPVSVGIEKGMAYNAVLPYLEDEMKRMRIFPSVQPLTHGGKNKENRIAWALQGRAERGRLYLKKGTWNRPFIEQYLDFPNPMAHDDLLDALAYIDQLAVTNYNTNYAVEEFVPLDAWTGI